MELNGADAKSAFLFFLVREKYRHQQDIININRDIHTLYEQGVVLPDSPDLDEFIRVPGVDYGDRK